MCGSLKGKKKKSNILLTEIIQYSLAKKKINNSWISNPNLVNEGEEKLAKGYGCLKSWYIYPSSLDDFEQLSLSGFFTSFFRVIFRVIKKCYSKLETEGNLSAYSAPPLI